MKSVFADTNVLLYSVDPRDPVKQRIAIELIAEKAVNLAVSVQVLQEFYWNATRKLSLAPSKARAVVEEWSTRRVFQPDCETILRAIDTSERYRVTFWDSLIIESAASAQCDVLYTEDLNTGQVIRGIRVLNPFAKD